jgi:hypothetical protein
MSDANVWEKLALDLAKELAQESQKPEKGYRFVPEGNCYYSKKLSMKLHELEKKTSLNAAEKALEEEKIIRSIQEEERHDEEEKLAKLRVMVNMFEFGKWKEQNPGYVKNSSELNLLQYFADNHPEVFYKGGSKEMSDEIEVHKGQTAK